MCSTTNSQIASKRKLSSRSLASMTATRRSSESCVCGASAFSGVLQYYLPHLLQSAEAKRATKEVRAAYDRCHKLTARYLSLHQRAVELCSAVGLRPPSLWLPQHLQGSVDSATAAAAAAMTPTFCGDRASPDVVPPELDLGTSKNAASGGCAATSDDSGTARQQVLLPGLPLISEEAGLDSGRSPAPNVDAEEALECIGHGKSIAGGGTSPGGLSPSGLHPGAPAVPALPPQSRHLTSSSDAAIDAHVSAADSELRSRAGGAATAAPHPDTCDASAAEAPEKQPLEAAATGLESTGNDSAREASAARGGIAALGIASAGAAARPVAVLGDLMGSSRSSSATSRLPTSGRSVAPWVDSARGERSSGAAKDAADEASSVSAAPQASGLARIRRMPGVDDDAASVSSGTSAGNTDTLAATIAGRLKSSAYFSLAAALGGGAAAQTTAERIESMRASAQVSAGGKVGLAHPVHLTSRCCAGRGCRRRDRPRGVRERVGCACARARGLPRPDDERRRRVQGARDAAHV